MTQFDVGVDIFPHDGTGQEEEDLTPAIWIIWSSKVKTTDFCHESLSF